MGKEIRCHECEDVLAIVDLGRIKLNLVVYCAVCYEKRNYRNGGDFSDVLGLLNHMGMRI